MHFLSSCGEIRLGRKARARRTLVTFAGMSHRIFRLGRFQRTQQMFDLCEIVGCSGFCLGRNARASCPHCLSRTFSARTAPSYRSCLSAVVSVSDIFQARGALCTRILRFFCAFRPRRMTLARCGHNQSRPVQARAARVQRAVHSTSSIVKYVGHSLGFRPERTRLSEGLLSHSNSVPNGLCLARAAVADREHSQPTKKAL